MISEVGTGPTAPPAEPISRAARYWATFLLFAPLFFQRLVIGNESDDYADYKGINLFFVGYAAHFLLLAFAITHAARAPDRWPRLKLLLALLAVLSVVQLGYSVDATRLDVLDVALPLLRGWLWLLAVASYVSIFYDQETFVDLFVKLCRMACFASLVAITLCLAFDLPLGVHIARGYPRVQGMFTEPSTQAAVFPAFVLLSLHKRRWTDAVLGLVASLLSGSVIVYTTLVPTAVIWLFARLGWRRTATIITVGYAAAAAAALLFINAENSEAISRFANEAMASAPEDPGFLYEALYTRLLASLSLLSEVLTFYSVDNLGSGLARLIGPIVALDEMRAAHLSYIGYGLNVYGPVTVLKYGDIFDFGFLPFLMTSFGIPAAVATILVLARAIARIAMKHIEVGLIFAGAFFSLLFNSAGGIHAYALLLVPLLGILAGGLPFFGPASAGAWAPAGGHAR